MKRLNKILVIAMIFVLTVSVLTGCRKKFDAKEYVEIIIDSITSMDYSRLEGLIGEDAAKELESLEQETLDSAVDSLKESFEEETANEFLNVYLGYLKKAKYTVQEAVETKDGYEVVVQAQPIMIGDGVMDRLQTEAEEYYKESQGDLDKDTFMKWCSVRLVEILNEKLENNDISYGKEQTVTLLVNENGEISEKETTTLFASLINVEIEAAK